MRLFNPIHTNEYRKKLRHLETGPEQILWEHLSRRQIEGVKFRRQCGVGSYIADFFSFEILLAIEVDGDIHLSAEAKQYDKQREDYFAEQSIKTIRFTNDQLRGNLPGAVEQISLITRGRIAELKLTKPPARKIFRRIDGLNG